MTQYKQAGNWDKEEHVQLMRQAARGEKAAYAEISARYRPIVLNYLRSLNGRRYPCDLDDMVQEVFTRQ